MVSPWDLQEPIIAADPPYVAFAVRPDPGVWEYASETLEPFSWTYNNHQLPQI